jgi:hypothetical protein
MLLVSQQHRVHRIPLPTSVTIAKRPSDGGGMWLIIMASEKWKGKYFRHEIWTAPTSLSLLGKSRLSRNLPHLRRTVAGETSCASLG